MSKETTKKRPNKTKEELALEMEKQNLDKFKEAIVAAETKFGYTMEPAMHYSKMGLFPQIEVVKKAEEVKEEAKE